MLLHLNGDEAVCFCTQSAVFAMMMKEVVLTRSVLLSQHICTLLRQHKPGYAYQTGFNIYMYFSHQWNFVNSISKIHKGKNSYVNCKV